jgi:ribosome maturation factor RimP
LTFADILRKYIGREIEVYLPNQFLEGTLQSVNSTSFVMEVRNGSYVDPVEQVTVFLDNVEGIIVLNSAIA